MSRLPIPGGDSGNWGEILNDFLLQSHYKDGTLKELSQTRIANLKSDLSKKSDNATTVHNDRAETLSGTLTFTEQPERTGQLIMKSVNHPNGYVQKNIVFKDEGPLSRGGPVWVDSNNRTQAWLGWHDQLPNGSLHHGVEIKTASDPFGSNPDNLITRFRLRSDADQTQAAFYSCEMLYIENGIHSPNTQFGLTFNTPQSGSAAAGTSSGIYKLGKLTVNVDEAGIATMDLAAGLDDTAGGRIRLFRDTNKPIASLAVYAADGTNTQTFGVDAKTGSLTMAGRLQYRNTANVPMFNQNAVLDLSGNTVIDNDALTQDDTKNATVRFFRNTNTTQTRRFRILKGDGTDTDSFVVDAGTGNVAISGDLTVTGNISANNMFDELELRRSSDVSTMNRLFAQTSLNIGTNTLFGVLVFAKKAGTFTKIRFATASGAQSATDLRLGVYDASNNLLAVTSNIASSVTSASTLYDNLNLNVPVTVTAGQKLYLAIAYTGTGVTVRGAGMTTGMPALDPMISRTTTYLGGALPPMGSGNTPHVPWIELVP